MCIFNLPLIFPIKQLMVVVPHHLCLFCMGWMVMFMLVILPHHLCLASPTSRVLVVVVVVVMV
jgi:hypothetical protein